MMAFIGVRTAYRQAQRVHSLRSDARSQRRGRFAAMVLIASAAMILQVQPALALITGGTGNAPMRDPGWPRGAAAVFNSTTRVAWWEGPPFGGGQWHAECRGDAQALNTVLSDFSRVDAPVKRVVVHDGVGRSLWLDPNRQPEKSGDAKIDWVFMVWQPANFARLRTMPGRLNPAPGDANNEPPCEIDVYTGGNVNWGGVVVPQGLEVVDQRLEAHGFSLADGTVLEGKVVDLATQRPIAARMKLESVEPQQTGGYRNTVKAEAACDANGRWVLKKAPKGWFRVVVEADGYVPRIVGHGQYDDNPRWYPYNTGLSRSSSITGQVTDEAGQPLADVDVQLDDMTVASNLIYESPKGYSLKTDAAGRFQSNEVPAGNAAIWVRKPGYCRPGLGLKVTLPAKDVKLTMKKSARIVVTVDFSRSARPNEYLVQIAPEGGERVGSWGGSGSIDDKNQITFKEVPPGRYVLHGKPNPSSRGDETEPVTVDLKGGEMNELTIKAK
jgi:hypothetical protein